MQAELRQLGLKAFDHRQGGVAIEVVHDQYLQRSRVGSLDDPAQRRHHVLALVVNGDDNAQRRRLMFDQMRPASISSRIHGTTSSSIASSEVVASQPSTSRALCTSETRRCPSCPYARSET